MKAKRIISTRGVCKSRQEFELHHSGRRHPDDNVFYDFTIFPWLSTTLAGAVCTRTVHTPFKGRTVIAAVGRDSVEVHATSFEKWGYPK